MNIAGTRIYLAGSGGMLGEAFYEHFSPLATLRCTDLAPNSPWLAPLDFRNAAAYQEDVRAFRPDLLFHLGALTDLEYCEREVDDSYRTNTLAVETAVSIANELGIPLLYISTAGIFDGLKNEYDDWDQPNPLGVYARSKYLGERHVVERADRFIICRAGWMMGGGPAKDKKFINKLAQQIEAGAKELHVVNDKLGTPTYTRDFAANVQAIFEAGATGLFNLVCADATDRLEVADRMLRILGREGEIRIHPVDSSYFAASFSAPRPACERLINRRLDLLGLNRMRPWSVALEEYLRERYAHLFR